MARRKDRPRAKRPQPTPTQATPGDERPLLAGLLAPLLALAVASLALPLVLAGRAWSFPGLDRLSLVGLAAGLVVAAAIWVALDGADRLLSRRGIAAWIGIPALLFALATVFALLAPESHIGDWQFLRGVVEKGTPNGKWYGAALLMIGFDRFVGGPLGLEILESLRLASSVLGASCALAFVLIARELRLPLRTRCWPALYLASFGVVGVGLAHVEIYSLVALELLLALWAGLRALRTASARWMIAASAIVGVALVSYLGMLLLIPVWLALAGLWIHRSRGRSWSRRIVVVASGALVVALICGLGLVTFPDAADRPLTEQWQHQFTVGHKTERSVPCFLPDDVHWPIAGNLIRPRHWLAPWHVSDVLQSLFLGDRLGLVLVLALLPGVFRRHAQAGFEPWGLVYLVVAAAVFVAYSALVVPGRSYPWDWDLVSYPFAPLTVLGGYLLASRLDGARLARRTEALVLLCAALAFLGGWQMYRACGQAPTRFGPPARGIALAVLPTPLTIDTESCGNIQVWLRNETGGTKRFEPGILRLMLASRENRWAMTHGPGAFPVVSDRVLDPGESVCLINFDFEPGRFPEEPMPLAGRHLGVWIAHTSVDGTSPLTLASPTVEVDVTRGRR